MPAIRHTAGTTSHNHAFEIIPGKGYDELSAMVIRTVETAAGYYFYFREDEDVLERLVSFITREKKKQPAFVFTLQLQEDITLLEITGPIGTKQSIISMMPR